MNIEKEFSKVIELIEKKYHDNLQENQKLHENFVVKCEEKYKIKDQKLQNENDFH